MDPTPFDHLNKPGPEDVQDRTHTEGHDTWAEQRHTRELLEFQEAMRACAIRRCSVIQVYSLFLLFLCVLQALSPFYLSLILFRSLQYINETLCTVDTYPFASRAL